jgi:hypothetical protein
MKVMRGIARAVAFETQIGTKQSGEAFANSQSFFEGVDETAVAKPTVEKRTDERICIV